MFCQGARRGVKHAFSQACASSLLVCGVIFANLLGFSVVHWLAEVAQESAKYALFLAPRTWFPDVKLFQFVFCISVDAQSIWGQVRLDVGAPKEMTLFCCMCEPMWTAQSFGDDTHAVAIGLHCA